MMGRFVDLTWESRFASGGLSRRQQRSGSYRAYLPDPLADRTFRLEGSVVADVADAERRAARFDESARGLANTEALARILLRAESVASSRIEGLVLSPQRLLRADVARDAGGETEDVTAREVLANVDAMSLASAVGGSNVTVDVLLDIHRALLGPTQPRHAGRLRTEQNWVGGSRFNPFGAAFVPPPATEIQKLLTDLCAFCNTDSLPAVAQAAIAHAQFETIHPFADGNGRLGRALVHIILRRRALVTRTLLPVSLVLATQANAYVAALQATRYEGSPDSLAGVESIDEWVAMFAAACSRAVTEAEDFEHRVASLQIDWRTRLGPLRVDATALRALECLVATPIVVVESLAGKLGVSYNAANNAVAALVRAGILTATRPGRRHRAFEARELIDAFTDLERRFASPGGDTRIAPPVRDVPAKPAKRGAAREPRSSEEA